MSKTLKQVREEIAAKQAALAKVFEEAGPDLDMDKVTSITGDSAAKAAEIKRLNTELTELGKESDEIRELEEARENTKKAGSWLKEPVGQPPHPGGGPDDDGDKDHERPPVKSLGKRFVESEMYKAHKAANWPGVEVLDVGIKELKTLFALTAGWAAESLRIDRVELTAERRLVVNDLPAVGTTQQNTIKYMEETTKTNAAAEAAEGGTYAESALALTERSSTVQKIATFIPVTDEQLEDVAQAEDYINARLLRFLQERLDSQLLVGNGTAPNLRGILNVAGIQTQAKGVDDTPTAIYKAITLVRFTGFAEPDACVLHPTDWQDIATLKTADGIFIWGSPAGGLPERIWGLPVIITPAETLNTGLVGAFRAFSQLWMRKGVEIQVSNSHSTFFIEGKLAVRADMRAAFVAYRPAAFCTITGI